MSANADIQRMIAAHLGGRLRVDVPVLARREKELGAEIEAAAAREAGLCAYVMPLVPLSAQDELAEAVYFDRAECRVRIIEQPGRNGSGCDAWQLVEDVATALQWHYDGLLAHPLQLARQMTEDVEDARWRMVDVIFATSYQLAAREVPVVPFTPGGAGFTSDLQAAVLAQLGGGMEQAVPVLARRDHDLASKVAASGHAMSVQVELPRPVRAMQGVPFVFIEGWEVRVRVIEIPPLNDSGMDAFDVAEDVAATLHWQDFGGLLTAHPLQIASRPMRLQQSEPGRREIEVTFNATAGYAEVES